MADGGLPEGMCVQGATGIQYQLPKDVPQISSSPTMMKMAAKRGHRGERSRKKAKTGRHSAPCTSTRPVKRGRRVRPAAAHTPAPPSTAYARRRPYRRTIGACKARRPKRYTMPWPGGTKRGTLCRR
jgi:hypothetical protein